MCIKTLPFPAASAASEQKNFDEESIASVSTSAHNETRDGFCPDDLVETSALQALQERTYGFSFWPKVGDACWTCHSLAPPTSVAVLIVGFSLLTAPAVFPRQDRVMINRMDNICEAVLKAKWPVNRRHLFDFPASLLPGHANAAAVGSASAVAAAAGPSGAAGADSPLQRRSLAELTMAGLHSAYGDSKMSPQLHVSPTHSTVHTISSINQ